MIVRAPYGELIRWMAENIAEAEFITTPLEEGIAPPDDSPNSVLAHGPGWWIGFNANQPGWDINIKEQKHEVAFLLRWG